MKPTPKNKSKKSKKIKESVCGYCNPPGSGTEYNTTVGEPPVCSVCKGTGRVPAGSMWAVDKNS